MSALSSLDPTLQLLLLLSRLTLSREQERAALALCARVGDWSLLARQAQRRFVLPLVYRHLRRLAADEIPPDRLEAMRRQCLATIQHNLLVAAVQRQLARELLAPLEVPHLFFKGPTLAARYYDDPTLRFCRDIDLLVPPERIVELVEAALQRGYAPFKPRDMAPDRVSLTFAARVQPVITLVSPLGVTVEIHQRIDVSGMLFDSDALLAGRESLPVGDTPMSVMPTAELFVYACFHHTRHHWSHLHWLVDLDAMQRHASFDLAEVRACAARHGLTTTVEAALELYRACAAPEPWRNETIGAHGRALVEVCLLNLQGDRAMELTLRSKNVTPDFAFAWQASTAHRLHSRAMAGVGLLRPNYKDYRRWPLPPGWQWLYLFTRPFRVLAERLSYDGSRA